MDVIYNMGVIYMYTDGACKGNPGPGGFGVISVKNKEVQYKYSESCDNTTNNREELKAILYSLLNYGKYSPTVTVYSDSAYAINTLSNWMFGWARNGWIKSDKKIPENLDLIKPYYEHLNKGYKINLVKVPGHSGVLWNEVADKLATGQLTEEDAYAKYC